MRWGSMKFYIFPHNLYPVIYTQYSYHHLLNGWSFLHTSKAASAMKQVSHIQEGILAFNIWSSIYKGQ